MLKDMKLWKWIASIGIAALITFVVQFIKQDSYISAWETASLAWALVSGLTYFFWPPNTKDVKSVSTAIRAAFFMIIPVGFFLYLKISDNNSDFIKQCFVLAPVITLAVFSIVDAFFAFRFIHEDLLRGTISKQLFYIVDLPFLFTVVLFTIYYYYIATTMNKTPEWKSDELNAFFNGATSLQLISANILFFLVDYGIVNNLIGQRNQNS
jgi:hypothetical protein